MFEKGVAHVMHKLILTRLYGAVMTWVITRTGFTGISILVFLGTKKR